MCICIILHNNEYDGQIWNMYGTIISTLLMVKRLHQIFESMFHLLCLKLRNNWTEYLLCFIFVYVIWKYTASFLYIIKITITSNLIGFLSIYCIWNIEDKWMIGLSWCWEYSSVCRLANYQFDICYCWLRLFRCLYMVHYKRLHIIQMRS